MTLTTTADALWAAILADTRDAAPKLALADLLDEAAADPELAAGLRWCAAEDRFPQRYQGTRCWEWFWIVPNEPRIDGTDHRYRIPQEMWDAIGGCFSWGPDPSVPVRVVGRYLLTSP